MVLPPAIPPTVLARNPSMNISASSLMSKPRPARRRPRRQATTTVELAFVFPVFFLFIFGLIDIGRGFMTTHLLTNAARQACRQSVVQNQSTADVEAAVKTILESQGIK